MEHLGVECQLDVRPSAHKAVVGVGQGRASRRENDVVAVGIPAGEPRPGVLLGLLCLLGGAELGFVSRSALWEFFCWGLVFKLVSDAHVLSRIRGDRLRLAELPCWFCKDLILLGIWALGAVKRTVVWRGTVLRIGPGSELFPAT